MSETEQNPKAEPQQTSEKEEADEKPEVLNATVVSRSTTDSSFVTDAKILLSDDIDDIVFTDNDFIISEEENKKWDEMIKQKKDELVEQKEKFERWEEEMTKRKMIVLAFCEIWTKGHNRLTSALLRTLTLTASTVLRRLHEMETIEKQLLDDEHKPKTELQQIFEPGKLNEQQDLELLPIVAEKSNTADSSFEVDVKILPFDDIDDAEFNDNNFIISEEERIEWDKMIKEKQDELVKKKEKFERWEEEMTKRKIFVLRKLKKLNSYHSKRMQFYTWINGIISSTEQN